MNARSKTSKSAIFVLFLYVDFDFFFKKVTFEIIISFLLEIKYSRYFFVFFLCYKHAGIICNLLLSKNKPEKKKYSVSFVSHM